MLISISKEKKRGKTNIISVNINMITSIIIEKLKAGHQQFSVHVGEHIIVDHMNKSSHAFQLV